MCPRDAHSRIHSTPIMKGEKHADPCRYPGLDPRSLSGGLERAVRQITTEDGFGGVSFFWHYPLDQLSPADLDSIRTWVALGIAYAVHGPYLDQNIGSHYEVIRRASVQDICTALDFAAAIGANCHFHPKMTRYGEDSAIPGVAAAHA